MCKAPKSRQITVGFSLTELVVVLAVAMILMAVGMPSFMRAYHAYQLSSAATQVADMLRLARYDAIRRNIQMNCVFQVSGPEQHQCLDRDYGNQRPGPVAEADRAWTVGEFGSAGSGSEYGSLDYCIQGDHGDEQSVADECDRDVRRSGSAFTSH
jgi:Tfp pilus assembly protein FimT